MWLILIPPLIVAKPWLLEMIEFIIGLRQLIIVLETNLYNTLQRLIGIQSLTYLVVHFLGIKVIKVEFRVGLIPLSLRMLNTASHISGPTISQCY